jgi:uncharacterized membrane protein YukC
MRFFGVVVVVVIVLAIVILSWLCIYEQRLSEAILQMTAHSTACFDREIL